MDSFKKSRKKKSCFETRPEYRNLIDSLALLKDFGYLALWSNDEEFAQSFNTGSQCPKYIALMNFLEKGFDAYCHTPDLPLHKATINFLKSSSLMNQPEEMNQNQIMYRLTTTNTLASKLLELCLNDLSQPNSQAMNILYSTNCGTKTVAPTVIPTPNPATVLGGTRPSGSGLQASTSGKSTKTKKTTDLSAARLMRLTQLAQNIAPLTDGLDMILECAYEMNLPDEEPESH